MTALAETRGRRGTLPHGVPVPWGTVTA
ncbi:MAG: hypothetical protein QOK35_1627, partial [Pseudonocardiales bacterium]|nr:hypothetical protein [Pseudonocardiales bacterium]